MNAHMHNHALVSDTRLAAHRSAVEANHPAAPTSLHRIGFGQPFLLDSAPHQLLVRVKDDMPVTNVIPVVVIASSTSNADVGTVFGLAPATTVRKVEVVRGLSVTWSRG